MAEARAFNFNDVKAPEDNDFKAAEKHLSHLKIVDKDGKPIKHALDRGHFSLAPGQCLEGIGSHYGRGDNTYGRRTASGEIFTPGKATVALPNFNNQTEKPFDVTVQDMRTGKMIEARVNDMGPHKRLNRVVDIESATFKRLLGDSGLAQVRVCRPNDKFSRNSHTLPGIIEL